MTIYVGNLPYELTEAELRKAFEAFGGVEATRILPSKFNEGQNRGFGFVDMPVEAEAIRAVRALNGSELRGRRIRVNLTEKPERSRGV